MAAVSSPISPAREWAAQTIQWNPARAAVKRVVHAGARVRGSWLEQRGRVPAIANIFAAGSPKAGSQWMKALFDHPVVRARTGLFTLPQLDYQEDPGRGFPTGTFVPGLYFSFDEYLQIPHRHPHRLVYMFRDPRDLLVSGYHSTVRTHRKVHIPELEEMRQRVREMPFDQGLRYLIGRAAPRLREIESWIDVDRPEVATFRLEEVAAEPQLQVDRMLRHCGVGLTDAELDRLLRDVSRESLQARDLAQRGDGESHYRLRQDSWREVFKPEHHEALEQAAPGLVARLGYGG